MEEKVKWIKGPKYISAFFENGSVYEIEIAQIRRDGLSVWVQHLLEKRWFDDRCRHEFVSLMMPIPKEKKYGPRRR